MNEKAARTEKTEVSCYKGIPDRAQRLKALLDLVRAASLDREQVKIDPETLVTTMELMKEELGTLEDFAIAWLGLSHSRKESKQTQDTITRAGSREVVPGRTPDL